MLKRLLLISFLSLGLKAHAQYIEYKPNPHPSQNSSGDRRESSPNIETQIVSAYSITSSNSVKKYKVKIAVIQNSIRITAYKELSSQYWTDFHAVNMPVALKLSSYDTFSENFEYKVYMASLGTTLYF